MKSSDIDQDLFTDSYCKVCSAQLISESQRVAHYEVRMAFPHAGEESHIVVGLKCALLLLSGGRFSEPAQHGVSSSVGSEAMGIAFPALSASYSHCLVNTHLFPRGLSVPHLLISEFPSGGQDRMQPCQLHHGSQVKPASLCKAL